MNNTNLVCSNPAGNLAAAALADEFGALRAEIAVLKAREALLKSEIVERGEATVEGDEYTVKVVEAVRWTIDTAQAKAALGEAWVNAHSRVTNTVSLRVSCGGAA